MLKAIEVENFKSFGSRTRIELAPITLVLGQNSAGKSSLLQVLTLLKQTRESRETGAPLLPRAEDGISDLGSFHELLFDHDPTRTLRIGIELAPHPNAEQSPYWSMRRYYGANAPSSLGLGVSFIRRSPGSEVSVDSLELAAQPHNLLAKFRTRQLSDAEARRIYPWDIAGARRGRARRRLTGAECFELTASQDIWYPIYRAWTARKDRVLEGLHRLQTEIRQSSVLNPAEDEDDIERSSQQQLAPSIADTIGFYSRDFTIDEFAHRWSTWSKALTLGLDGFVPVRLRQRLTRTLPEVMAIGTDENRLSLPSLDLEWLAHVIGRMTDDMLETLFPLGPWRRPPQRWYIFTGTSPLDVGYRGDLLPDLLYRHADLVDQANTWLSRLDIGYRLLVKPIGEKDSDLFEVRLADVRRGNNIDVALPDVGFGVSQILPFIVQCLAAQSRIISIEQPEVHIHPRLQADLGELLATTIKEPYNHQFLIETHSEHLVLRLQKLVRTGVLRPEDLSILFVSRGERGSSVVRLHVDTEGDFIDEWPGGFFPERLSELR